MAGRRLWNEDSDFDAHLQAAFKLANRETISVKIGLSQAHWSPKMLKKWWVIVAYRHTRPTLQLFATRVSLCRQINRS